MYSSIIDCKQTREAEIMLLDTVVELINLLILLFIAFNFNYMKEKGKNQATKEDITDITHKVEQVKQESRDEYDRIKTKRQVYQNLLISMGVFLSGRNSSEEVKSEFLDNYANSWLWASDSVLDALNMFIDCGVRKYKGLATEEELKDAYRLVVIEMRKDAGFQNTVITSKNFEFVSFAPK
jgi:hypothetical protein